MNTTRPSVTSTADKQRSQSLTAESTTAPGRTASPQTAPLPRLRIRMYRHGLGDCLLLRFRREDNANSTFNVLIDCGLITVAQNAAATMTKVATDIASVCGNRLDVVVMSHEHWDHVSGFSEQQARKVFDGIDVGEVWYAWTEDPQHEFGQRLRKERARKVQALARAVAALNSKGIAGNPLAAARATNLAGVLSFFGLDMASAANGNIGKTREAFDYLLHRSGVKTRYCAPNNPPMSLPGVPGLRVYVLGPPEDEALIKKSSPSSKGREVYKLVSETSLARYLECAFLRMGGDQSTGGVTALDDCPFDPTLRRQLSESSYGRSSALEELAHETWSAAGEEWRRIEDDWTQVAETLALNLDSHTNNTCLVLAFEFTDTGDVFLFPADAQVGNWLSWQDLRWKIKSDNIPAEVTGPDLLARTIFYKVGHPGSHHATLRTQGLEQMTHDNLVAFIPVFRDQAVKNRWLGMPFEPLVKRLDEKTSGRLLRSDQSLPNDQQLSRLVAAARQQFLHSVETAEDDLWFEYRIDSA